MKIALSLLFFALFFGTPGFAKISEITFEKKQLVLGSKTITVEIADTSERSARGLMYRKSLKDDEGMLFIFQEEKVLSFWMKNTFIPLSIGFFNKNKVLIDVQDMEPVTSEMQLEIPSYTSKGPALYALEVPKGWFKKHKISLKSRFHLK